MKRTSYATHLEVIGLLESLSAMRELDGLGQDEYRALGERRGWHAFSAKPTHMAS